MKGWTLSRTPACLDLLANPIVINIVAARRRGTQKQRKLTKFKYDKKKRAAREANTERP